MNLLLDTHLLLWAAGRPGRLSATARKLIDAPSNELFFSAASIWEVAIKRGLGGVTFEPIPGCCVAACSTMDTASCQSSAITWSRSTLFPQFTKTHSTGCWWPKRRLKELRFSPPTPESRNIRDQSVKCERTKQRPLALAESRSGKIHVGTAPSAVHPGKPGGHSLKA